MARCYVPPVGGPPCPFWHLRVFFGANAGQTLVMLVIFEALGGGDFSTGPFRGELSFFRLMPKVSLRIFFCTIWATSCSMDRRRTFFSCRGVLVPVYCMLGSVHMRLLMPCSCHCPQSLNGRYPQSSGSPVKLWTISGSPGTHGAVSGWGLPTRSLSPVTAADGTLRGHK